MKWLFLSLMFVTLFISCNSSTNNSHVLDFGDFFLVVPTKWEKIKESGIDSYVGRIKIDSTDYISFDLGRYSNNLEEYLLHGTDTSVAWTIYPPLSQLGKNRNSRAEFAIIDGKKSKVIIPIKSGIGMTGIYIDSIRNSDGDKIGFEMSGNNLKPINEKLVLEAFKTLRFKNSK